MLPVLDLYSFVVPQLTELCVPVPEISFHLVCFQKTPKEPEALSKLFDGTIAGNRKTISASSASAAAVPNTMSSEDLLAKMRSRNYSSKEDNSSDAGRMEIDPQYMELITDIRNFLAFQCAVDGQATTQEIMTEFGPRISSKDSSKFKAMLKQLCHFDRRNGIGVWQLKSDFR